MASVFVRRPDDRGRRTSLYQGRWLELERISLRPRQAIEFDAPRGDECLLSLLTGSVEWNGRRAERDSVFDGLAHAAYVPSGARIVVTAMRASDLLLATSRFGDVDDGRSPEFVGPDQVTVHTRGRGQWEREVHDVAVDDVPARHLMAGETFNPPGGWSSFPPHKHDGKDGEPELEEVYHFRFDPPEGFGFQGLSARAESEAFLVHDGDTVGIPSGYHPVCAAPGFRLYYHWVLAGPVRRLEMVEDPRYSFLH